MPGQVTGAPVVQYTAAQRAGRIGRSVAYQETSIAWHKARSSSSMPKGFTASSPASKAKTCSFTSPQFRVTDTRPSTKASTSSSTLRRAARAKRPRTSESSDVGTFAGAAGAMCRRLFRVRARSTGLIRAGAKEPVETNRGETLGAETVDDEGQRPHEYLAAGLRVAVAPTLQEQDCAGARAREDAARDELRVVLGPVAGRGTPQHHAHVVVAHDLGEKRGAVAVGWAVEDRTRADRAPKRVLRALQLRIARVEPTPLV